MPADPTKLAEAREALAVHDHHPREVCPECCEDVCDPCVDALRWALAEVDRLTAELSGLRAYLTRSIADDIGGMDEGLDLMNNCPPEDMARVLAWCDAMRDPSYWSAEVKRLTAQLATAEATGRRKGLEEAAGVCGERATTRENAAEQMHETGQYRDATTYRTYAAAERALAGTLRSLAAKVTP